MTDQAIADRPGAGRAVPAQAVLFRGAGISIVWPQFLAMGASGACLFGDALTRLRSTLSAAT